MNWNDLNIIQKSDLIGMYISNGITRIADMKKHFNQFADGGSIDIPPEDMKKAAINRFPVLKNVDFEPYYDESFQPNNDLGGGFSGIEYW